MKIIFWNVQGKLLDKYICEALTQENPDIFILAEGEKINSLIFKKHNFHELNMLKIPISSQKTEELRFFCKTTLNCSNFEEDKQLRANWKFLELKEQKIFIISVHFPSKLKGDNSQAIQLILNSLKQKIECLKNKSNKIIIVGDFNINPYEVPLRSMVSIYTSNCPKSNKTKTSRGRQQEIYYNPSLYILGNFDQSARGTYFYEDNWHVYDQIIMTPNLKTYFDEKEFKILELNSLSLLDKKQRPTVSDHLPIVFKFNI